MISALLTTEQTNELSLKNHEFLATSVSTIPKANVGSSKSSRIQKDVVVSKGVIPIKVVVDPTRIIEIIPNIRETLLLCIMIRAKK